MTREPEFELRNLEVNAGLEAEIEVGIAVAAERGEPLEHERALRRGVGGADVVQSAGCRMGGGDSGEGDEAGDGLLHARMRWDA